jgi:hypothetical protein
MSEQPDSKRQKKKERIVDLKCIIIHARIKILLTKIYMQSYELYSFYIPKFITKIKIFVVIEGFSAK